MFLCGSVKTIGPSACVHCWLTCYGVMPLELYSFYLIDFCAHERLILRSYETATAVGTLYDVRQRGVWRDSHFAEPRFRRKTFRPVCRPSRRHLSCLQPFIFSLDIRAGMAGSRRRRVRQRLLRREKSPPVALRASQTIGAPRDRRRPPITHSVSHSAHPSRLLENLDHG